MGRFKQGVFKPKNPRKYCGIKYNQRTGESEITFRSSYEQAFMQWCDMHPSVLEWSSEEVIIKYFNPVKQREARYIMDFYVKYKDKNGKIHEEIIEVKPYSQTIPPKKTKKKKQSTILKENTDWMVNTSKWQQAKIYAQQRGWRFRIITEQEIFRTGKK